MKQIIEIKGVKMEVDLRVAQRIDTLAIGTRVKVLQKTYSGHEVKHGVIIGFEPFVALPTVIVAYVEISYATPPSIKFLYYNAETKDVEMVVALDDDKAALDKAEVVSLIEREIERKLAEVADLRERRAYFEAKFACYWTPVEAQPEQVEGAA